jgi:DNA repair exonuclease SbcCD ATPase subunit
MEKEQLEKKIEWLDDERRKAVAAATELEKRLAALEKALLKEKQGSKTRSANGAKVGVVGGQVDELEKEFKAYRTEAAKEIRELSKQRTTQEKDLAQEQKGMKNVLEDFRKEIGQLQILQTGLNSHGEKIEQLAGKLKILDESVEDVLAGEQRRVELSHSLEDNSKKDVQRLTEMHAEVASLLGRLEASAKKTETILMAQRKVDKRMDELTEVEEQRRTEQKAFFDKGASELEKRQRQWKEWSQRFDQVEQQSSEIGQRLKDIETTDLAVKRAQKSFDELVEKINRRVNELGEIQRLGDQRFRQEWSTFQADAQKRWANFNLTHEEQQREGLRQREKLAEQLTQLEDSLREVQDSLHHLSDQSERNLQTLLELARDSLAENERFFSNQR